jgi:glycosyltransferase involved in cell wall biosynthesis
VTKQNETPKPLRLAYLTTKYPAISHTFIEREVRGLRRLGIDVHTFSVRLPEPQDVLSGHHQEAARQTCYLLDSRAGLLKAQWGGFLRHPLRYLRVLWEAQRLSLPGLKWRGLYTAYALEAVRLARELRRRGLRHVHVHLANNGAMVGLLTCVYDPSLSYSLTVHGPADFFAVEQWRLPEKAQRAVFVRCISEFTRSQLMYWTDPSAWSRYHVVHCGLDVESYQPRRAAEGDPRGPLRLVAVGRLDPVKGHLVLLEALKRVTQEGVDCRLTLVGEGPMKQQLVAKVAELGLNGRVVMPGAVGQDHIQSYYEAADVMVVSSFAEGLPVVLMEAMAKQLPVICTAVAGVPELVEHGVNGWLVPAGSVEALAKALKRLGADRVLLRSLGAPARRKVVEEFSIATVASQMAELLRRYAAPPG